MQIGLIALGGGLREIVEDAKRAEAEGFALYTMANISGHDAIGTLTVAGWETDRIRLMTGVVPTYPRHPGAIAQQALTAATASSGRFTLGIGLSHRVSIEGRYGISFDRPAVHMRQYLDVLLPLLRGESIQVEGEQYTFRGALQTEAPLPVPCVIAAMAPVMLRLAGERTAGTILWMTGARAIREHVQPRIAKAAAEASRPRPEIVCGLPIALTSDVRAARERANRTYEGYGNLPSYRAMLDKQGAATPGDAALVGDEASLRAQLAELKEAGVTAFTGAPFNDGTGSGPRTREFLASLGGEI
jgi:F420-dependent oxidoreductase-like protein